MAGPLTEAFGKEVRTTYSGNALNRLSFLREDSLFLYNAFHSEHARFLPFLKFNAGLINSETLAWQKLESLAVIVGEPFKAELQQRAQAWNPQQDASGVSFAQVVFLGNDENEDNSIHTKTSKNSVIKGAPRFAVDVTVYDQATPKLKEQLQQLDEQLHRDTAFCFQSVIFGVNLTNPLDFSIIAEARIVLDWINRVRYCGGCGRRNMSAWGGFKLLCPTSFTGETQCPTKGRVTNLSFPRTDCCIIVAVISHDGSRVLVGRGRRFRGAMYSCLAGFLESGESIEDCVRREVFEEAGVRVGRVVMHSSQPWPYPANLMIGCLAEVVDDSEASSRINLGYDEELLDAKWVSKQDLKLLCKGEGNFDFSIPPSSSIAWVLLNAVANDLF